MRYPLMISPRTTVRALENCARKRIKFACSIKRTLVFFIISHSFAILHTNIFVQYCATRILLECNRRTRRVNELCGARGASCGGGGQNAISPSAKTCAPRNVTNTTVHTHSAINTYIHIHTYMQHNQQKRLQIRVAYGFVCMFVLLRQPSAIGSKKNVCSSSSSSKTHNTQLALHGTTRRNGKGGYAIAKVVGEGGNIRAASCLCFLSGALCAPHISLQLCLWD